MPAVPVTPLVGALTLILVAPQGPALNFPVQFVETKSERTSSIGLTRLIATVALPGSPRFVAAQHFREGNFRESMAARVKILWIGRNFRRHFLSKIEENTGPTEIGVHHLRRSARDPSIIAGIGERHETQLSHVWALLSQQPSGEHGPLAHNGIPNVFYVRAGSGVLWAVDVVWSGAGWEIGASATDDRRPWRAGRQIFSR